MADYVRGGQVSWEYRPFLIFPSDPGIFQLLACRGPTEFFPLVEQLYSSQAEWAGRLEALSRKRALRLEELQQTSPTSHSAALIRAARLDRFFRQSGMSEAAITACLADEAGLQRLADANQHGVEQDGVIGTPTFFINGIKQDAYNWSSLERLLRGAMRQ
jgi:protein-disulfide isomerase